MIANLNLSFSFNWLSGVSIYLNSFPEAIPGLLIKSGLPRNPTPLNKVNAIFEFSRTSYSFIPFANINTDLFSSSIPTKCSIGYIGDGSSFQPSSLQSLIWAGTLSLLIVPNEVSLMLSLEVISVFKTALILWS